MGCEGSLSPRSSRAPSPSAERRHTTTPAERTLGELLPPSAEPHTLGELLPPSAATSAAGAPTHRHPTAIPPPSLTQCHSMPAPLRGGAAAVLRWWCGGGAALGPRALVSSAPLPLGVPLGSPSSWGGSLGPRCRGRCGRWRARVVAVWSLCGRCVVAVWSLCGRCVVAVWSSCMACGGAARWSSTGQRYPHHRWGGELGVLHHTACGVVAGGLSLVCSLTEAVPHLAGCGPTSKLRVWRVTVHGMFYTADLIPAIQPTSGRGPFA